MPYYKYHVFFCTNLREDGRGCCQDFNATEMRNYLKGAVKDHGLAGEGGIRINTAGCLNRCSLGPVVVIYPEETWYTYVDKDDLDEILEEHLKNGRIVERLLLGDREKMKDER
ncbi:MAG TPA: (2Fe-2S) ferredoxin domain-containing protein [Gammaproteobacteria bacterium]|nr:(2Fe-2S) ferredoxin domain-containing protein [Gammaproteobacteria bacterium]